MSAIRNLAEGDRDQVFAVVTVTAHPIGSSFENVVREAYLASRDGIVIMVLDGVSTTEVDDALDPLVPLLPLTIPGVRYVDAVDWRGSASATLCPL
jgi:hypothetical protein